MNLEMWVEKIYHYRALRISVHLLFWIILAFVGWHMSSISFNPHTSFNDRVLMYFSLANTGNQALFYYPFVYFILPRLFKQQRYFLGVLSILVLVIFYTWVNTITETLILKPCASCMEVLKESNRSYYGFLQSSIPNRMLGKLVSFGILFGLLFSVSIPLSIKFALQAFRHQLASIKLAKQNVELEFNFLKSQVNPHFLFNSLNNIYGLILKSENIKAASIVARLSEFMRYSLYNSTSDKMPLVKEIQLIKDYIELESIRLNHTKVNLDVQPDDEHHVLPSLLLMPVVENAFKYTSDNLGSHISLKLFVKDKKLYFSITNTIDENKQLQSTGGIGLQNFKRRLSLYYPGKHHYNATFTDQVYSANLLIEL